MTAAFQCAMRLLRLLLVIFTLSEAVGMTEKRNLDENRILPDPSAENVTKPLSILLLVEPSPITYVSGYANRYQALMHHLTEVTGDHVELITVEKVKDPVHQWRSVPVHHTHGLRLPHYPMLSLSLDWSFCIPRVIRRIKPDILHVSSPGFFIFPGLLYSRLFRIPLVASYHTHLPVYVRSYLPHGLRQVTEWLVWQLIRVFHSMADLTLVTSPQMQDEFAAHGVRRCQVWQKGIDTERFHPRHVSDDMRRRMTNNRPDSFLLVYIGRLGSEKRLVDLRAILDGLPSDTCLCLVGGGPQEVELQVMFAGTRTVFLGPLHGEELSQAFASGDVFVMPSDSETLGFVVLESMASEVPVVGADAGGIPHLIEDEVTGYLVPVGDIDGYVRRLLQLRENASLRKAIVSRLPSSP